MTSKAKTTSQISPVLASMSLADALTALHDLDRDYAVTPDAARQDLASALAEVLAAAGRNGITTVTELIEGHAHLLQNLTGLTNPTAFHKTENAEQLHRYRNVITALAAAAAHSFGADTKPIWASALRLKSRTCHRARPLRDDEILLARVHAAIECAHKPSSQRAGIYAMTEAGMAPGETTGVALDSFDEPHDPQMVLAAGNGHLAARQLPMDHFAQALLGRLTRDAHKRNKPSSQPLTYAARKAQPSVNAKTASAQGVLDRMLVELGLNNSDITASSITQWRIHNTYINADVKLAQQLSGRTTIKQMEDILFESQPPRTALTQAPAITSFLAA